MHINKSNAIFKELKEMSKNNKQDMLYIDDVSILKVIMQEKKQIETLLFCDDVIYHDDTKMLIDYLKKNCKNEYTISQNQIKGILQKENSVEIVATMKMDVMQLEMMRNKDFLVVTDSIEIPGNLGTIYRTLDSAKVDGIICVDSITKLNNPKLTSSARGANLLVPTATASFSSAVDFLVKNGYKIYLGEPNLGKDYKHYDYQGKIAIVVGNERFGINSKWYDFPHEKVYIPMFGSNNSLNVGVALSILVYEAKMKRTA